MQEQDQSGSAEKQAFLLRPYQQRAVEWAIYSSGGGLIIAPAGCGKTLIAASIIKRAAEQYPTLSFGWLAPTRETCQQAIAALEAVGVNPNRVEARCPHESVDFSKKAVVIVDEAKHAPADSWRRIIESCTNVYGFDATPWGDDAERNTILRNLFRNNVYEITRDDIAGVLAHATVYLSSASDLMIQQKIDDHIERLFRDRKRYMRIRAAELRAMCAWEAITDIGICANQRRNDAAIMFANCGASQSPTLVLVPRISLGETYAIRINGSVLVHSKMPKKARREAMEEFRTGNIKTMIATSLADEGLDLPNVKTLVMVSGGRSVQKTIQRASRALRRAPGKNEAYIHDFRDVFHPLAQAHAKKRLKCYQQLGCAIA